MFVLLRRILGDFERILDRFCAYLRPLLLSDHSSSLPDPSTVLPDTLRRTQSSGLLAALPIFRISGPFPPSTPLPSLPTPSITVILLPRQPRHLADTSTASPTATRSRHTPLSRHLCSIPTFRPCCRLPHFRPDRSPYPPSVLLRSVAPLRRYQTHFRSLHLVPI